MDKAPTSKRRVLILCKTYPSPSSRYVETSCVAGMEESGALIRLYPVPFRLIEEEHRFRKWQWISARIRKATDDKRPESHRISVDTIEIEGQPLPTANDWIERRRAIGELPVYDDFAALENARQTTGVSLGLVRPARILELRVTPNPEPEWTREEVTKLMQAQNQGNLFDIDAEQRSLKTLKKLPYDFHYIYECDTPTGIYQYRHKLVDWEAGALYWNVHRRPDWERAFRHRLLAGFEKCDLLFLLGNIHRFQDKWLIVSLIYPPKSSTKRAGQLEMFGDG